MQTYPAKPVIIDFHGNQIVTVEKDGEIYVAMKPVIEGMGLNWASQSVKLRNNSKKYRCCDIAIPTSGGIQKMLCMPLTKLNGWFFSVNPLKVRAEIRTIIELYQEECFIALYDYWHKGVAVNPRYDPERNQEFRGLRNITIKLLADETENAFRLAGRYGITGNQAKLTVNAIIRFRYDVDCLELLGITDLAEDETEEHLTPTEIGRQIGCSVREVNRLLTERGLQTSFRDRNGRLIHKPTEKGMPFVVFKDTNKKQETGTPIRQFFWKKSVIILIS